MNKIIISGRLTKKAEVRFTENETPVASFTLAVNRIKKEEADFINIVAWNKLAEIVQKYTDKGHRVLVNGRLQTRNWEDENGNKHYTTEVVAEEIELLEKRDVAPQSEEAPDLPF